MIKKIKILIADDDPNIRYAFVQTLEHNETIVLEASDGEEAIRILKNEQTDLAFLDYSMPKLDGFGVLEKMRIEGIDIPAIIITGF